MLPIVFDQGECEGCWAHAESALVFAARGIAGKPMRTVPSPLYFMQANYARLRALATPAGQKMPALMDTGAELDDAAITSAAWGEVPFQAYQQSGRTDVPATIGSTGEALALPEMTEAEAQVGTQDLFGGEYSIPVDNDAPKLLMAALDAKILVWDGFYADPACENLGPNDILGAPVLSGGGGHSTLYYGYDLNAGRKYPVDGPVFFKRGSWGPSYCRDGNFYVSTAHVVNSWALWPYAIKVGA